MGKAEIDEYLEMDGEVMQHDSVDETMEFESLL